MKGAFDVKQKIFNFDWIYTLALLIFWFIWGVDGLSSELSLLFAILTVVSGIGILYVLLRTPLYAVFSEDGVSTHFLFGFYQEFKWKTIWKIERAGHKSEYLYYRISGDDTGKKCFFTSSKIRANKAAKQYIQMFWKSDFNE